MEKYAINISESNILILIILELGLVLICVVLTICICRAYYKDFKYTSINNKIEDLQKKNQELNTKLGVLKKGSDELKIENESLHSRLAKYSLNESYVNASSDGCDDEEFEKFEGKIFS